jgi:putative ABC transport system ATP-binding protein
MVEQIVNESSADGDTVIDVIDVRKSYQIGGMEIPILNDIDLTVRSGEKL